MQRTTFSAGADTANGQVMLPADGTYSVLANIRAVVSDGSRIIARIDVDGDELVRADSRAAASGTRSLLVRRMSANSTAARA